MNEQEKVLREALTQASEFIEHAVDYGWDRLDGIDMLARIDAALAAPTTPNLQPMPAAWIEGPHGAIRANPLFKVNAPQSVAWQIALYPPPALAAPAPTAEPAAWLPIETAPERGPILVIDMKAARPGPAWGCYRAEKAYGGTRVSDWYVGQGVSMAPTHWMPLPPPPAVGALSTAEQTFDGSEQRTSFTAAAEQASQ